MIGSLMYLTTSRPDIMFAVCACARFQVTLKTSHLLAVKRIFRYLKDKPTLGLWYSRDSPFELVAYTDSDYAGATQDRKSTTGATLSFQAMFSKSFQLLSNICTLVRFCSGIDNYSILRICQLFSQEACQHSIPSHFHQSYSLDSKSASTFLINLINSNAIVLSSSDSNFSFIMCIKYYSFSKVYFFFLVCERINPSSVIQVCTPKDYAASNDYLPFLPVEVPKLILLSGI
ncbi:hypothetical protein Tco_0722252 [Tanacetum coccineum]